jgi:hypothetical protein
MAATDVAPERDDVVASDDPFFERRSTKSAIESLASDLSFRIVPGAGVPADAGLPPWPGLIEKLLDRMATDLGINERNRPGFVEALLREQGHLTAASIVQASLGEHATLEGVREALYRDLGFHPEPGFHANVVADIIIKQVADGMSDVGPITTNYDRLLEDALIQRIAEFGRIDSRPVSVVSDPAQVTANSIPVFHIHGCVAPQWDRDTRESFVGTTNQIILGERDYARLQQGDVSWQDELMAEMFAADRDCLFTGMSMTDPNMVRYLIGASRVPSKGRLYALLARQSERRWTRGFEPTVAQTYQEALNRRLSQLEIRPIVADYYIQVSQFLSEVFLYSSVDSWSEDLWYGSRLRLWRDQMTSSGLSADGAKFSKSQAGLSAQLTTAIEHRIVPILERHGIDLSDEHLSLELWLRNNRSTRRSLELWGSSVQMWTDHEHLAHSPISFDSSYSAVAAFMRGGYSYRPNGRQGSRWKYQLCTVVRLPDEPWFNLPVGVLILNSSRTKTDSCLTHLVPDGRRDLQEVVHRIGRELSEPSSLAAQLA